MEQERNRRQGTGSQDRTERLNEQDLDTEPDDRTEDHTGDLSRYREQEQDQRQGCRHEQNQVQVQDWVQIQAQTRGKRQTSDGNQTADS